MASRAVTPPSSPRRWSGSRARTCLRCASRPAPTRSPLLSRRPTTSWLRLPPTVTCPLHLLLRRRELRRILIPRTGVKIDSAAAHFHGFGVARQGPWVTWVNKGKKRREPGRRISLPHYLRPGSLLSGSLSDSLGHHLLVNRCPHKLGVGTHERELRAIRGDEDVAVYSGTIPKGDGACAIRLDRIRPSEAIVMKNLPVKVT